MRKLFTLFVAGFAFASANAQATFISQGSGSWSTASTWSLISGVDSDNIPDANDIVTVVATHTVGLSASYSSFASLTIQNNGFIQGNGKGLGFYGNLDIQGKILGTVQIYFFASGTFNSASTYSTAGQFWVRGGVINISAATVINKPSDNFQFQFASTINNYGSVRIGMVNYTNNNCIWNNMANSSLTLSRPTVATPTTGVLNATAAPNSVTYESTATSAIKPATYYNLTLRSASTKSMVAAVSVLNNFTMLTGNVLNANNYNLTVGGNWINTANTTVLNQATVTLNPSGTGSITRSSSEVFTNLVVNGSGTTLLGTSLNISNNLTLSSGNFDVSASNYTVNVGGNLTNNANFITGSGLVNLNGSLAQTISGTSVTQFYALTLNNAAGAVVNTPQVVTDVLTVSNGNFNSNGNVTLASDASKTARLGVVGAGGSFTGNMIIQKHVSGRVKNWHDLSSPVQNTIIFDWDDEMYMSGFSTVDSPVGIAGVDGAAGTFKSVRVYNEPTATYANVTNSATALAPCTGYYIWLSDDMNNWNAKTFDSRGIPNFGTQNKTLSFSASAGAYAGTNLVGNPFASAIDYSLVNKTNTDGHAYGFDNGVWTDYGTNAILTPHQGFWAYATGAGASISFPENCKSSITATSFHRTAPKYCIKLIYTNSEVQFFNEAKVNIAQGATEKWDIGVDAIFINNPEADASTVSFNTGEMKLLTNAINDEAEQVSLPVELFSPKAGLYYIQPSVQSIGAYKYAWLENTITGEKYNLDNAVAVNIDRAGENNDFVLKLSKQMPQSEVIENVLVKDLFIFNYEQTLTLKSNQQAHKITRLNIVDMTGKVVYEQAGINIDRNSDIQIDLTALNNGMYIVTATDDLGNTTLRKIAK